MAQTNLGYGVGTAARGGNVVEVDDGNFEYDDKVLVETSQREFRDIILYPTGGIINTTPKSPQFFTIDPMIDKYLQLNMARLEIVVKIVRQDGGKLNNFDDIVAPINLLGACLFEQVEVILNGQPFPGACQTNAGYKAFIDAMLSNETDARHTHMQTQLLQLDSPGLFGHMGLEFDQLVEVFAIEALAGNITVTEEMKTLMETPVAKKKDPTTGADLPDAQQWTEAEKDAIKHKAVVAKIKEVLTTDYPNYQSNNVLVDKFNIGFVTRYEIFQHSEEVTLIAPIPHDFFNLNNHIGPGNKIDLKLTPYPDKWLLNTEMYEKGYKVHIQDLKLHLRTIERSERIKPPLIERYRMNQTELHKQVIPKGMSQFNFRMHHGGVMPKTIVIAMTTTNGAEGAYNRNPFFFHHFHLKKMNLNINGEVYPSNGLRANFSRRNPDCARLYNWMFENTGAHLTNRGNLVAYPAFSSGCFLVPFDLTPDKCNGVHNHQADYGYIELELEFDGALPDAVTVLYEMVFNKYVINDKLNSELTFLDVEAAAG